ncbi:S-adenosyl-L-methionine-dependent methyltransferase [Cladochytrium replicatum]|nr:S-adenosyl-L-methionine-dependent methyltransferase [Cladochytrium replicatum]
MPKLKGGLFEKAAGIIDKLLKEKGRWTIKSLVYSEDVVEKKRTFQLVCETLKYRFALLEIIKNANLLQTERKLSPTLACVLVCDLLFGSGALHGAGITFRECVFKHKTRLSAELVRLKIRRKVNSNEALIPEHIRDAVVLPRYARVNTIKSKVDDVVAQFQKQGYNLSSNLSESEEKTKKSVMVDTHIPDVLVFPAATDLHDHPLVTTGSLVLQDKASCLPAFVLSPPQNSVVIDACAAPGNKTTHLAAIMNNTGRIYAFDKDRKRLETLKRSADLLGCSNIKANCVDFLEVSSNDPEYKDVQYILLDPSCSGSGIVRRLDHLLIEEEDPSDNAPEGDRVAALAKFQTLALLHAFSFPSVRRVVYSTCSRHSEENESVVLEVLSKNKQFRLVQPPPLPSWTRRGIGEWQGCECLIRADPAEDRTIGFLWLSLKDRAARFTKKVKNKEVAVLGKAICLLIQSANKLLDAFLCCIVGFVGICRFCYGIHCPLPPLVGHGITLLNPKSHPIHVRQFHTSGCSSSSTSFSRYHGV